MKTTFISCYDFNPNRTPVLSANASEIESVEISEESVTTRAKNSGAVMITSHNASISGMNTLTGEFFSYNLYDQIISAAKEAGVTIRDTK